MSPRSCLLLSCALLVFSAVSAQRRPGSMPSLSSATNLRVRVVLENDRPPSGTQFLVRVMNVGGTPLREGFTDFDGHADMGPVAPGFYTLSVSSPQTEDTTTQFEVQRYERTHFEYVRVKPLQNGTGPKSNVSAQSLMAVPEKARKEADKGNEAVQQGDFVKAAEHYRKAIQMHPSYAAAENNLGAVCLHMRDFACARGALEKAVELDSGSVQALVNLARLRAAEQNMPQAESLLQHAIALQPTNPQLLTFMAQAELVLRKYADAVLYARKVHTVSHQGLGMAHLIAAQALQAQGKQQEAAVEFRTFLQEAPNDPMAPRVRSALAHMDQNASRSTQR